MELTVNLGRLEWMVGKAGVHYFKRVWIQKGRRSNVMGGNVDVQIISQFYERSSRKSILIYFDFRKFEFANEDQTNLMFASY